jgi:hypothetical protein
MKKTMRHRQMASLRKHIQTIISMTFRKIIRPTTGGTETWTDGERKQRKSTQNNKRSCCEKSMGAGQLPPPMRSPYQSVCCCPAWMIQAFGVSNASLARNEKLFLR